MEKLDVFLTSRPTGDAVLNESDTKQIARLLKGPAREPREQRNIVASRTLREPC